MGVKVKMDGETRRFSMSEPLAFDQLMKMIRERFEKASSEIQLSYTDPDGDLIVFSSDEELNEALRIARTVGSVLRLDARETMGACVSLSDASTQHGCMSTSEASTQNDLRKPCTDSATQEALQTVATADMSVQSMVAEICSQGTVTDGCELQDRATHTVPMRTVDQSTQNSSAVTESATQMTSTSQSSADVDELQSVLAAVLQSVGAEHIAADQLLKYLAVSAQPLAHDVLSAISSSAASLAQQISAAANKDELASRAYRAVSVAQASPSASPAAAAAQADNTVAGRTAVEEVGLETLRSMGFEKDPEELCRLLNLSNGNVQLVVDNLLSQGAGSQADSVDVV